MRSRSEICTEEILIKVGGELSQHLATAVAPLLIHDLPVVLWWPDDVPFGSKHFMELGEECDRLLVDSGQFRGDGVERLVGLRQVVADGLVVHDIGWMRGMLWRELLAGIFDHPLLTRELTSIRSVRIDVAKPGRTVRLARAATFAGWLAAMLDWSVAEPMKPDGDVIPRRRSGSASARSRSSSGPSAPASTGASARPARWCAWSSRHRTRAPRRASA